MLKMVVKFDKEKAKEDAIAVEQLYSKLDKRFAKRNLKVCENGVYVDKGNEEDLMQFMIMASALAGIEWFVKYIKQWFWYEESEEPEDLIKVFELAR